MKKFLIILAVLVSAAVQASAQKVGYIDTEKILSSIPAYKSAQQELESLGGQYQSAIEAEYAKIEALYNRYQQQKANLTAQARQARENEIIQKEQAVKELQKEYFGADGVMQQHSSRLLDPIREKVDAAISKVAEKIYERHTLLSQLLQKLGVSPETAAEDACKLEHAISDESMEAIKKHLNTL